MINCSELRIALASVVLSACGVWGCSSSDTSTDAGSVSLPDSGRDAAISDGGAGDTSTTVPDSSTSDTSTIVPDGSTSDTSTTVPDGTTSDTSTIVPDGSTSDTSTIVPDANQGDAPSTPVVNPDALAFKRVIDTPYPGSSGTTSGDMAVGDLNGDGFHDIVVTGTFGAGERVTHIYLQKADGTFATPRKTAAEHGLPGLDVSCLRLADVDKDADLDVVAYGKTGTTADTAIFKVFKNDGKAMFQEMYDLGKDLPMEDFEDVNGSWGKAGSAPDNKTDENVKGLYNFNGWSKGVLELGDLNGDGYPDIVFAGTKGTESGTDPANNTIQRDWETSGVFMNDGKGGFIYLTAAGWPAAGVPTDPENQPVRSYPGIAKTQRGAAALAEFNGDGKLDLVLFGQANTGSKANAGIPETQRNGKPIAEVYLGKGDGSFSLVASPGLPPLIDCAVKAADINADGKMDVVALGSTGETGDPAGGRVTKIYLGKGDGTFSLDATQTYARPTGSADVIAPTMNGDLAFGDLDGDGDLDMVSAGNDNDRSLYLYINKSSKFSLLARDRLKDGIGTNNATGGSQADAVMAADTIMKDMDGDGDMDILVNGRGGGTSTQLLVFYNKAR